MTFYDPDDLQMNIVNGNLAHLVFHSHSIQKTNVDNSVLVNIDPYQNFQMSILFSLDNGVYHLHSDVTMPNLK
jgi:hypothetical protein